LPYKKENGSITIATSELNDALKAWATAHFGEHVIFAITSPYDIRRSIETIFPSQLTDESRLFLYRMTPGSSARYTLNNRQRNLLYLLMCATLMFAFYAPNAAACSLVLGAHLMYAANMLFKQYLFLNGINHPPAAPPAAPAELPVYT